MTRIFDVVVLVLLLAGQLPGQVNAGRVTERNPPLSGAAASHPWHNPTAGAWDAGFQFPGVDGDVSALVQDANGNIYLGGHFTHVGNQPISNVAQWNSATATWSAVGSIGGVRDLALAANGHLYAVGDMVGFAAMLREVSVRKHRSTTACATPAAATPPAAMP